MKLSAILLLILLTVLRFWLAATSAVTPREAYYWMCAQHPHDWAFFDGPSGTAWLVHLGTLALGDGPAGLRLLFPLFAMLATGAAFLLARSLFGPLAAIWAALALNALPFFNQAAVHVGPDLPALAFTVLAAWASLRALEDGLRWWLWTGISIALAVQFHYAAILLLAGIAASCASSSRHRSREWRKPGLYLSAAIALAGLIPGVIWNQSHDWPAFALGTMRTALTPRWGEIGPAIVSSSSLFTLTALAGLAFAVWILAGATRIHVRPRAALCLAGPFVLLWLYDVLHGEAGYTGLLIAEALLAGGMAHTFLSTAVLRQFGACMLLATAGFFALPSAGDPWTTSTRGIAWPEVAANLNDIFAHAQNPQSSPLFLIAQDPDTTAALNYYLAHTAHPEVFLRESQDASNQFALWPRYDDFVETPKPADDFFKDEGSTANPNIGRSALYLTDEEPEDLPQTITGAFGHVTPFAGLDLGAGRKMRVYLCEDYQTMPL